MYSLSTFNFIEWMILVFFIFYYTTGKGDISATGSDNYATVARSQDTNIDVKRIGMFKRATVTVCILMISATIGNWPILSFLMCISTSVCSPNKVLRTYLVIAKIGINSGLNPFIYAFRMKEYRRCLKKMFMCSCGKTNNII